MVARVYRVIPLITDEEKYLKIMEMLSYRKWYCGHYHTEKKIDKLEIMFENFDEFCGS